MGKSAEDTNRLCKQVDKGGLAGNNLWRWHRISDRLTVLNKLEQLLQAATSGTVRHDPPGMGKVWERGKKKKKREPVESTPEPSPLLIPS